MTVIALSDITRDQLPLAGGKGANLGELIHAGFPVPPGFVIGADAYETFIAQFNLPANENLPEDTAAFLDETREKILATPLPGNLLEDIRHFHAMLQAERQKTLIYAVRSSATAEDMADASFAGQHDTYYYVAPDDIELMVRKCWASLWSDAAFSYRQSQGIEHRDVFMAVVIQEMVQSEVSGVSFTADPVSGSDSVIITESSWGMGAAIVDGRVSPDQYVVEKQSLRLTAIKISDKKFMVPAVIEPGQVSRLQEVPAHLRHAESLSDDAVAAISTLAQKAELHFGAPQDIEWAIQDDQVFMLQSRPITVLGSLEADEPDGQYILFKPLVENFTEPLMPVTQDILGRFVPFMHIIHGRVYMDFKGFKQLVPLKLDDEDFAQLAYLSEPATDRMKIAWGKLLFLGLVLFLNHLVMGVFNRRTADLPDDFMTGYRRYVDRIVDDDAISPPAALYPLFLRYRFFEPAGHMVMLVNLVAPRYMLLLQVLGRLVKRWAPTLADDTPSLLCAGIEGVLSTDMGRSILNLARIAKQNDSLSRLIRDEEPTRVIGRLAEVEGTDEFQKALAQFQATHGHRTMKEFELCSVRWDEDPSPVIGMVRNYLLVDADPDDTDAAVENARRLLHEKLEACLLQQPLEQLLPWRNWLINRIIHQTRYYMKLRENSRFYHIMGFYGVRRKLLKIETDLMVSGQLKCKDDIFYLHWHEIEDLVNGTTGWFDVEETIRARRMEHIRLCKMTPPRTIGIELEEPATVGGNALSGQGASPGSYEGTARLIMDPATDNEIEPGEILIAPYTDPAWTPLFLTANAAVIEVGSYLSHAGTIAREYGMPCVVDVSNCTTRIQTGMRLKVDGSTGSVTILDEAVS